MRKKNFRNIEDLKDHIQNGPRGLFHSSQTSTVIPYDKIQDWVEKRRDFPPQGEWVMCNLSDLPQEIELIGDSLRIRGCVTWKEAREFCRSKGRDVMTTPTEELASVLAGLATSATGERSFGLGTLREQVEKVIYIDGEGVERSLEEKNLIQDHPSFAESGGRKVLSDYQNDYKSYHNFKNAPYPRLEKETDLMIGTEGQLGVIVEAQLKTIPFHSIKHIFILLPKWEEDYAPHFEIYEKIQQFRGKVLSCELLDDNSLSYIPKEDRPGEAGEDLIFLEIIEDHFEEIYFEFLNSLELTPEEKIFEISPQKCHELRMSVPRAIFEVNSKMGVVKKGTDVQIGPDNFKSLMDYYRTWSKKEVKYNLFGHFGDGHLHFNFMPTKVEEENCQKLLTSLYGEVLKWKGSPFAEHGIGMVKQDFIRPYWNEHQFKMFGYLKKNLDPRNVFFPFGYMSMENGHD